MMEYEKRISTLTERQSTDPTANVNFTQLQGSQILTQDGESELGKLTEWKTVSPLEFKLHILTMVKQAYNKNNDDGASSLA